MRPREFACSLFLALPLLAAGTPEGLLTLEGIFHPAKKVDFAGPAGPRYAWLPDGSLLESRTDKGQTTHQRLDPKTGERRAFLDTAAATTALVKAGAPEAEAKKALGQPALNEAADAALLTLGGDLYWMRLPGSEVRRLTRDGKPKDLPAFSPDGKKIAFLRGNDIHAIELDTRQEIRLTRDGGEERLNGRMDWIYEEEVYDRGNKRAFWWSPDSRLIAFLQLDISKEPVHTLVDDRAQPQKLVSLRYPKAGEPNPVARLGVVDFQGTLGWMEDPYPGQETLIVQVGWDPKGKLLAAYQDRIQTWLELRRFDGSRSTVLIREQSKAWQDRLPLPRFLKDGSFLWLSDRTGFRHIYRFDPAGRLLRQLTDGPWDVQELHGVDEGRDAKDAKNRVAYFSGTERSPIGLDAYSVPLDAKVPNAKMQRLTEKPGTHALSFPKTLGVFLDRWSDAATPTRLEVRSLDGKTARALEAPTWPGLAGLRRGAVKFQQVKTRDGFLLESMLVLPPDFDPARKYPVLQPVYAGPKAPTVHNAFGRGNLWYHFLAQQGIVVFACDPRSASSKGAASAHSAYRRLGVQELADLEDSLAWLGQQGWADMNRIAMEGWSYGGFMTTFALTHSDKWKAGVAGAPVTDWALYDSIYTERYMGLPKDNLKGYEGSSVLRAVPSMKGSLLLFHGTLDDNVHPQNSVKLIDALQKADKDVEFVLLPGSAHGPRSPEQIWVRYRKMWEFLKTKL